MKRAGQQISSDALMTYAFDYYNVRENRKIWGQKAAEEQIVVLADTIKELRDANLKLGRTLAVVKKDFKKGKQKVSPPKQHTQKKKPTKDNTKRYTKLVDIDLKTKFLGGW
eukprot:1267875-Ditylum_brightwellii.AAC.1